MTTLDADKVTVGEPRRLTKGQQLVRVITTTDHKMIGKLYLVTSFAFFLVGGLMAMVIRAELARPGLQFVERRDLQPAVHDARHDHAAAVRDPAVRRLRELHHAAPDRRARRGVPPAEHVQLLAVPLRRADRPSAGFLTPQGAADFGWSAYAPLSNSVRSPGVGGDLWIMGLWMVGLGTILGAVNFVTTIFCMRAPGHDDVPDADLHLEHPGHVAARADRLPDPRRRAAAAWRRTGRSARTSSTPPTAGPCCGSTCSGSSAIPRSTSSRCRSSASSPRSCRSSAASRSSATSAWSARRLSIAALSVAVWAHHMFVTGAVNLPFFSFMTFLIAVPTGVKFFNWIGTMWGGSLSFDTPMLWAIGFLTTFLFGGLTGVILASPPLDFQLSDSYFVVAHFHYVVFGTVVFAMFAGLLLLVAEDHRPDARRAARQDPLLAAVHRLPHHVPRAALARRRGHAPALRRLPADGRLHHAERDLHASARSSSGRRCCRSSTTSGSLAARRRRSRSTTRGAGAAPWSGRPSCPPPRHNFAQLPRIRSESPAFDLHHPEIALPGAGGGARAREGRWGRAGDGRPRRSAPGQHGDRGATQTG